MPFLGCSRVTEEFGEEPHHSDSAAGNLNICFNPQPSQMSWDGLLVKYGNTNDDIYTKLFGDGTTWKYVIFRVGGLGRSMILLKDADGTNVVSVFKNNLQFVRSSANSQTAGAPGWALNFWVQQRPSGGVTFKDCVVHALNFTPND